MTMVTTDQPPDEAEDSSGSSYAYAAENILELRRSIKQRMFAVRYGADLFLIIRIPCKIYTRRN